MGEISKGFGKLLYDGLQAASGIFRSPERDSRTDETLAQVAVARHEPVSATEIAAELHEACWLVDTDVSKIHRLLAQCDERMRNEVVREYRRLYGTSLESQLREDLAGDDLVRALHLLRRTDLSQRAELVFTACLERNFGNYECVVDKMSLTQRKALNKLFEGQYGSPLILQLRESFSGTELFQATHLLQRTDVAQAAELLFAACCEPTLLVQKVAALGKLKPEPIAELDKYYRQRYGLSIAEQLHDHRNVPEIRDFLNKFAGMPSV